MTIEQYIQQEVKDQPVLFTEQRAYKNGRINGIERGLDIGMRFAEWCSSEDFEYENEDGINSWFHINDYLGSTRYTTAQLLEIFLDHLNKTT